MLELGINVAKMPAGQKVTMHTHCVTPCASRLVQGTEAHPGIDLYIVMEWIGHSSIEVTQRYAKFGKNVFGIAVAPLQRYGLSE